MSCGRQAPGAQFSFREVEDPYAREVQLFLGRAGPEAADRRRPRRSRSAATIVTEDQRKSVESSRTATKSGRNIRKRVVKLTAAWLMGVIASGPGPAQQMANMIGKEKWHE